MESARDGYRPCVGVVLFDGRGRVFAGRRIDTAPPAWQFPQGGIDRGESAREAGLRELAEEIGTDRAEIIAELPGWLRYDLPPHLAARLWGGRYRGQAQKWLLARFAGVDGDIDLAATADPEFDAWRWMDLGEAARQVVPFKRPVYARLVAAFAPRIAEETGRSPR